MRELKKDSVKGTHYSRITRLYIRSKRDQYFVVRTEFRDDRKETDR